MRTPELNEKYNFACGNCGKEIKRYFTRCAYCKNLVDWETWLDNQYAEKVVRAIPENTYSELAIVHKMVMLYAAFVKYPGPINSIYSMS